MRERCIDCVIKHLRAAVVLARNPAAALGELAEALEELEGYTEAAPEDIRQAALELGNSLRDVLMRAGNPWCQHEDYRPRLAKALALKRACETQGVDQGAITPLRTWVLSAYDVNPWLLVTVHLSQVVVLLDEAANGYPEHVELAYGHLDLAGREASRCGGSALASTLRLMRITENVTPMAIENLRDQAYASLREKLNEAAKTAWDTVTEPPGPKTGEPGLLPVATT